MYVNLLDAMIDSPSPITRLEPCLLRRQGWSRAFDRRHDRIPYQSHLKSDYYLYPVSSTESARKKRDGSQAAVEGVGRGAVADGLA